MTPVDATENYFESSLSYENGDGGGILICKDE